MVDIGQNIIKKFCLEFAYPGHPFYLRSPSVCAYCFHELSILHLSPKIVTRFQIGEGEGHEGELMIWCPIMLRGCPCERLRCLAATSCFFISSSLKLSSERIFQCTALYLLYSTKRLVPVIILTPQHLVYQWGIICPQLCHFQPFRHSLSKTTSPL